MSCWDGKTGNPLKNVVSREISKLHCKQNSHCKDERRLYNKMCNPLRHREVSWLDLKKHSVDLLPNKFSSQPSPRWIKSRLDWRENLAAYSLVSIIHPSLSLSLCRYTVQLLITNSTGLFKLIQKYFSHQVLEWEAIATKQVKTTTTTTTTMRGPTTQMTPSLFYDITSLFYHPYSGGLTMNGSDPWAHRVF